MTDNGTIQFKEVSIKAKSRQELLESEKIAKDLLAAMGGNNG